MPNQIVTYRSPPHVPNIFPLKLKVLTDYLLSIGVSYMSIKIIETQHPRNINDRQPTVNIISTNN